MWASYQDHLSGALRQYESYAKNVLGGLTFLGIEIHLNLGVRMG